MSDPKQALMIIDMQKGFDSPFWGERNNLYAEEKGLALLDAWRTTGLQVILVRHDSADATSPLRPRQMGNELMSGYAPWPEDWLIGKTVNSAFIGTNLQTLLRSSGIEALTIFGLTTDQCVSTTVRMASNFGFATTLVEDACACFAQRSRDGQMLSADQIHLAHVTTLHSEFARVLRVGEVIASLAGQQRSIRQ